MNICIQKNADYCVSVDGLCMTPEVAREYARQLIECAHECDKRNRRFKRHGTIDEANDLDRHVAEYLVQ